MNTKLSAILLACSTLCLSGCFNTQHIENRYEYELSRLYPGDSVEKFQSVFPTATAAGQKTVDGQTVDAYEVVHVYRVHNREESVDEKLTFYFANGKFVKWAGKEAPPKPQPTETGPAASPHSY